MIYNTAELKKLVTDYAIISGVDVCVLNVEGVAVAGYNNPNGLCHYFRCNNPKGNEKCNCSDNTIYKKCRESGKTEMHLCHAGLVDIATPIIDNNVLLGYIVFGRIRNTDNFDEIYPKISWLDVDYETLKKEFFKMIYYDGRRISSIIRIITSAVSMILTGKMIREQHDKLSADIADYIDKHLSEELSVNHLCEKMHITKNILYEHFHFSFNTTVSEYITRKRLEKAKRLLAETELTIADIADQCGIKSYTYFFSLMKKYENTTPAEYRKQFNLK